MIIKELIHFPQDKYILGSLLIQFCICAWHAIIGSLSQNNIFPPDAVDVATQPPTTTSSYISNVTAVTAAYRYLNTTTAAAAASTATPTAAIYADWIAMGALSAVYIVFQITFLALIGTNVSGSCIDSECLSKQVKLVTTIDQRNRLQSRQNV